MAVSFGAGGICAQRPAALPLPVAAIADSPAWNAMTPLLAGQSSWGSDRSADESCCTSAVGDGRVCVELGRGPAVAPALQWFASSPQKAALRTTVERDGAVDRWRSHRLRRVRRSQVLVGEDRTEGGVVVRSLTVPAQGRCWQLLEVTLDASALPAEIDLCITYSVDESAPNPLPLPCGMLVPGTSCTFALCASQHYPEVEEVDVERVRLALASSLTALQSDTRVTSDPPQLADFLHDATLQLAARRHEGIGPVAADGSFVVADACATGLAFLAMGHDDWVTEILETCYRLAARTGAIESTYPRATTIAVAGAESGAASRSAFSRMRITNQDAATWIVMAHYSHLRQTGSPRLARRHWPMLEACVESLADTRPNGQGGGCSEPSQFTRDALHAHCVDLLGDMQDRLQHTPASHPGRQDHLRQPEPDRSRHRTRSLQLLAELEARYWQPTLQRFTGHPGNALGRAEPVGAADLRACQLGMVTMHQDHCRRHVAAVLSSLDRLPETVLDARDLGSKLVAETQFDNQERARSLRRLLACSTPLAGIMGSDGSLDVETTAMTVDAALYALSGRRIAIGASIDVGWYRLKPLLPTWCHRLGIHHLRHDGVVVDVTTSWETGPVTAQELATPGGVGPRALASQDESAPRQHVTVDWHSGHNGIEGRLLVLQFQGRQFLWHLSRAQGFAASAPAADAARSPRRTR
jgi:hypothetical protein